MIPVFSRSSSSWIKNALLVACIVTLVAWWTVVGISALFGTFFISLNLTYRDFLLTADSYDPSRATQTIVIVEIDDETLQDPERGGLGRWQEFRREWYSRAVENLIADGAAVVGLDVLLSEPSRDEGDDIRLENTLGIHSDQVVLGFFAGRDKQTSIFPLEIFSDATRSIGFFNQKPHPVNRTIYTTETHRMLANSLYESFPIALLRRYYERGFGLSDTLSAARKHDSRSYTLFENDFVATSVPYASYNSRSFFFRPKWPGTFERISFRDVLSRDYPRSVVEDKIVLIGATATALQDEHPTAIGRIPGVYIHASGLATILTKSYLVLLDTWIEHIWLLIFLFLIASLGIILRSLLLFTGIVVLLLGGFFFGSLALAGHTGFLIAHTIETLLGVLFTLVGVSLYRYMYEDAGRRVLQEALSQYLAKDLVIHVLDNYESVKLGGTRREVTSFFSDIEGFTTMAEHREPEELVRFLSIYLKEMSDIIIAKKWFVNKYEGDAIMALWGAFSPKSEDPFDACEAALLQQEAIEELNAGTFARFGLAVKTRMGINCGSAIVGNIGSLGKKIEFTALGDSVNIAARLESANKIYKTTILISEAVADIVRDVMMLRRLDRLRLRGKNQFVRVYELVGRRSEVDEDTRDFCQKFDEAMSIYDAGNFSEAAEWFEILLRLRGDDGPTKLFLSRSVALRDDPPESWDGTVDALEK